MRNLTGVGGLEKKITRKGQGLFMPYMMLLAEATPKKRSSGYTRTDKNKWVGEEEYYYNPPLLEIHCTLGCWDLSPCGFSRLLCGRCSTSTFHNRTWIYLLWVVFNNFDFLSHHANFLSKKRSVKYIWTPRSRKFASSPWKQTAE